jgi:hypothetical protein
MCKSNTWKCTPTWGSSFAKEKNDPNKKYDVALCSEFVSYGCQKVLDCCPDDSRLFDFVENNVFGNDFPTPNLPTPSCTEMIPDPKQEGAFDSACGVCKDGGKGVKLEFAAADKLCPYPDPKGKKDQEGAKATFFGAWRDRCARVGSEKEGTAKTHGKNQRCKGPGA